MKPTKTDLLRIYESVLFSLANNTPLPNGCTKGTVTGADNITFEQDGYMCRFRIECIADLIRETKRMPDFDKKTEPRTFTHSRKSIHEMGEPRYISLAIRKEPAPERYSINDMPEAEHNYREAVKSGNAKLIKLFKSELDKCTNQQNT